MTPSAPAAPVPRVAIETLGCKLNQYESEALATELKRRGYQIVADDDPADVRIVNSCTVTAKADRKSRNAARRAGRSDARLVILTGCFVDNHRDRADRSLADYQIDNEHKALIPDIIDAHLRGETNPIPTHTTTVAAPGAPLASPAAILAPPGAPLAGAWAHGDPRFAYRSPERIFRTRATLKVQDGCDNFCTFCIIPTVRGRAASRRADAIVDEARAAIASGTREIVLTGVNMSRYDDAGTPFAAVVERLLAIDGDWRLRISSLEPDSLDDRFIALFRHPRMSPHLHLCLQSGSDRILLAMRRMYTRGQFDAIAGALRRVDPAFNLTTDVIVGFPGERDVDFAASLAAIERHRFGHVHAFPYSRRAGTRADRMADHVPTETIRARGVALRRHAAVVQEAYRRSLVGTTERVLVERVAEGVATGLGEHYVPIAFPADETVEANAMVNVAIVAAGADAEAPLVGELRR